MAVEEERWQETAASSPRNTVDVVDGLLALDRLVQGKNRELRPEWTIYMRVFGGPLTAKTDLMFFIRDYGIGGIEPDRIAGVETDAVVEERGWGQGRYWDKKHIHAEVPGLVQALSEGKRLVVFEGVYSALFHPLGKWWFYPGEDTNLQHSMDIELECVASYPVRSVRALRRDRAKGRLDNWGDIGTDWMTPFDGRDLLISTDLAEHTDELDKRVLSVPQNMRGYLQTYAGFCKNMKAFYTA